MSLPLDLILRVPEAALPEAAPARPPGTDVVVRDVRVEAADVAVFTLVAADGAALPAWQPGDHVQVRVGDGSYRSFSLFGDPGDRGAYRIAVRRAAYGRGGSAYLHGRVRAGMVLWVRGPVSGFTFEPGAAGYRFVAGGIGITALLPMFDAADREGVPWRVDYYARADRVALLAELGPHRSRVRIHLTDRGDRPSVAEVVADIGEGETVYACGPESMLAELRSALDDQQALGALHTESFHEDGAPRPSFPPAADPGRNRTVTVRLARTGETVVVAPEETVLEAAARAGARISWDCGEGTCGTCLTRVLDGDPEHRDYYLEPDEIAAGDRMLVCVSRAAGDELTLDA